MDTNKPLPAAARSLAPYESSADQMIGGLYIHDPKTCFHCQKTAMRQSKKTVARWRYHASRNVWSVAIGQSVGLSRGCATADDSAIRRMGSTGRWN